MFTGFVSVMGVNPMVITEPSNAVGPHEAAESIPKEVASQEIRRGQRETTAQSSNGFRPFLGVLQTSRSAATINNWFVTAEKIMKSLEKTSSFLIKTLSSFYFLNISNSGSWLLLFSYLISGPCLLALFLSNVLPVILLQSPMALTCLSMILTSLNLRKERRW